MQQTPATPPAPRPSPPPVSEAPPKRAPVFRIGLRPLLAASFLLPGSVLLGTVLRLYLGNQLGWRLETATWVGTLAGVGLAALGGWLSAHFSKRVGFPEVALASLLTILLGFGLLAVAPEVGNEAFHLVPEGALWFGPLFYGGAILLTASVVASLAYMLGVGRSFDASFGYELAVARSHLRLSRPLLVGLGLLTLGILPGIVALVSLLRRQRRSPTLIMTVLSIGGVSVGVMALCVVLSVMSGFEVDLKQKILGTNAHAVVLKYGVFEEWEQAAETARETPGVLGVTPFVINEVMITSDSGLQGALIKGIDPESVGEVTELPREIVEGDLSLLQRPKDIPVGGFGRLPPPEPAEERADAPRDALDEELERLARRGRHDAAPTAKETNELPGIVIGRELARQLRVFVGDPVTVVSPIAGELGPMGPQPKSMQFRVAGVFFSGMYEYDSKFVYITLERAQSFFKMGRAINGLELKVNDIDDARRISRQVLSRLEGYPYWVKDWGEMNRNLFSALKLEKVVMAVILAFIILVACFNILSTLVMLVLEKGKEISILKSMGAKDASVMKIFVLEGLAIGAVGTAVGLSLGLLICGVIHFFPIPLDPEVYYISHLPVRIDLAQFAFVGGTAVLLTYLATIFPALYASRLSPVEGLRND